jgi:anti-sigma factor RsiW
MEKMCPDRQILSVYFDNELDSPWKKKLETHLKDCPHCRARLELYRDTREAFVGDTARDAVVEAACGRILENLETVGETRRRPGVFVKFWRGRITVPFPVAAAAGLVLAAAFALLLVLRPQDPPQMADMGMEVQTSPVTDMASLLEYLNGDNSPDMVIIRLPETAMFRSAGEPRIIRASDYSRNGAK